MTDLPLNGIRILDFSRLLPGPYGTQLLADLGAEVIKIETPLVGDYARIPPAVMGLTGLFEAVNRGKKSVAINYRNPRGRELYLKLAATADVILEGFRPGTMDKYGLGYEALKTIKPEVVYCSLSGYGQSGPYRHRAGHDPNYLALGGAQALNAQPGDKPVPYGLPVADLSGGMLAAIAILGALVGRERKHQGLYLDMAIFDGVISWMTPLALSTYLNGSQIAAGTHPLLGGLPSFNNIYETADNKYLTIAALEPSFWGDFCKITGRADLLPRQFDRSIGKELADIFRTKSRDKWLEDFAVVDGCLEPVNSIEELLTHPQVRARGYVHEQDGRPIRMNSPFVFARQEMKPAPKLGEHTREYLIEIGIDENEIAELVASKVIGIG
jgi:alpha-methylacyl-CoA racemase